MLAVLSALATAQFESASCQMDLIYIYIYFYFSAAAAVCAGTVAKSDSYDGYQPAVCAEHPMAEGAHYVEMTLLEKGFLGGARMGVVGQGFDAAGGGAASESAEGWMLLTVTGHLYHAGTGSDWEGKPQYEEIKEGDVVGLLLDVGQRTLSVYLNGARRGRVCPSRGGSSPRSARPRPSGARRTPRTASRRCRTSPRCLRTRQQQQKKTQTCYIHDRWDFDILDTI